MSEETDALARKEFNAAIMAQLLESERFVTWFRCNYQVSTRVDEETKTATVTLHECPGEEVERRFQQLIAEAAEDEAGKIQIASPGDLKKMGL